MITAQQLEKRGTLLAIRLARLGMATTLFPERVLIGILEGKSLLIVVDLQCEGKRAYYIKVRPVLKKDIKCLFR